jgi:1,4-dihydroxy-2-naphthoate octaprenyltransferase
MEKNDSLTVSILRIAQPILLIGSLLTYTLGLGIAHYLSFTIDWGTAILGSTLVLFLLTAKNYLSAFFTYPEDLPSANLSKEIKGEDPDFISLKVIQRNLLLQIGLVALGIGAAVTFVLMMRKVVGITTLFALGIALLFALAAAIPPFRVERRGYGELIEGVMVCNLIPAIAFLLQNSTVHPFLGILTFPLTFVYLAMKVATSLEYFAFATKYKTGTMIVQMGWQRAISMHNLSILLAFLLLGGFVLLRLPWMLAWSIFLALPLGLLQIFLVQRIADGAKPHWWMVRLSAISTFGVMAYLTTLTLWMH